MSSPRIANAPFDDPDADFILRTSDGVDFRVFRAVLSLASPVFKDMLSLPQPASTPPSSEPPTITLSESSTVLSPLLLFCYPAVPPTLSSLGDVRVLLEAASKYDLTSVVQEVAAQLVSPRFLETNPIGVYCVACHCGLEAEANIAALQALNIPSLGRPVVDVDELNLISIPAYHRLLKYHVRCGEIAASLFTTRSWCFWNELARHLPECEGCDEPLDGESAPSSRLYPFVDKVDGIAEEFRSRPSPTTAAMSSDLKEAGMQLRKCAECDPEIESGRPYENLVEGMSRLVRDEVVKVPLEFKS